MNIRIFGFKTVGLACLALSLSMSAHADIDVTTTTSGGTVPNSGGITYTISDDGGTARAIWSAGQSNNATWAWSNAFPEFETAGGQTLIVRFSAPVPVDLLVFGVNSISDSSASLTVSGGTASLADFDLSDGLTAVGGQGLLTYNDVTGVFTNSGANDSVMIGSNSTDTITSLVLTGNGDGDGFTLFFGTVDANPVPEPSGVVLLLTGMLAVACISLRRRTSTKTA